MPSSRRTSQRRLVRPATVIGGLLLLLVGLALLAIPFLEAPGHAEGAQTDLEAARDSLTAGDVDAAEASVQSARRHADQVQDAMQGIGGDVWSLIPVVGEPVSDVRHLGNALDHLTTAAEVAVRAWPAVNGDDATLFADRGVDLPTLESLVTGLVVREHAPTAVLCNRDGDILYMSERDVDEEDLGTVLYQSFGLALPNNEIRLPDHLLDRYLRRAKTVPCTVERKRDGCPAGKRG